MIQCPHQCDRRLTSVVESIRHDAYGCEKCEPCKICGGNIIKEKMALHKKYCHDLETIFEDIRRKKRIEDILRTMNNQNEQ